ncbi:MAG: hypothetical protein ACRD5H_04075 [Nitrososphaerales archaeon]
MSKMSVMQTVFSERSYIALAIAVSTGFFLLFSTLDEYLFFSPIVIFHVPQDGMANFSLSVAITILLGIIISMNLFMFKNMQLGWKQSRYWLSGSFIATATGACGCTSLGFAIISTFGGAGILATSFVTNYQLPLKMVSLAILIAAYYSLRKNMIKNCISRKDNS